MSERELKAVEMYKKGEKVYKIFLNLGLSSPTLYKILRKYKVPLRREVKKNE